MTPTRTAAEPQGPPRRPGPSGSPRASGQIREPAVRQRLGAAVRLWGLLTLGGVTILAALILWHLARRGRLLRARLGPPRHVRFPDVVPPAPAEPPPAHDEARP